MGKPKDTKSDQISNYLIDLSDEISAKLIKGFKTSDGSKISHKSQDIVTKIDHEIGRWVGEKVTTKFGNVKVDSEEHEERFGEGSIILKIDPVDGSKHFASGIELFSSVYSLSEKGVTFFGMVINPFSNKVYYAQKGKGAFLNRKRINVNNQGLDEGFLFNEQPTFTLLKKDTEKFKYNLKLSDLLLEKSFRVRNVGLASFGICWVAEGAINAYIDLSGTTKLYDVSGPILIAREAGAIVASRESGKLTKIKTDKKSDKKYLLESLIIANPKSYDQIVALFSKVAL